ncbi:hypothetical protein PVA19_02600 [Agrobacterium sp. CNPSo 3708]|nr:hypothetical protein [Agrobacterium sp. CNPSo 3708]
MARFDHPDGRCARNVLVPRRSGCGDRGKVAIVPLYLLATKGLRAHFQDSSLEDADFKAVARFQFSDAALLAAFVVIVAAHADSAAGRMVMDFVWIAALTGGTLTVAIWLRQKRQNDAQ